MANSYTERKVQRCSTIQNCKPLETGRINAQQLYTGTLIHNIGYYDYQWDWVWSG